MNPDNVLKTPEQVGAYTHHILSDFQRNNLTIEDGLSVAGSLVTFILLHHNVTRETGLKIISDVQNMITTEFLKVTNEKNLSRRLNIVPSNSERH